MSTIFEIFGPRRTEGVVGVEIEVEGVNLPQRGIRGWKAVPDGSLRNGGIEYVTNGAITLKQLSEHLDVLKVNFAMMESQIADAHRGSVHIHVNVQDKTPEQVFTTLFLWLMVESLWMERCGPTRNGNLFCMSSSGSGEILPWARQFLARSRDGNWFQLWQRGKYSALNTDCIQNFGSLEFRTFPSSVDKERIEGWAQWCTNLVEEGCKLDPDKLYNVWQKALDNPRAFYKTIFGDAIFLMSDEALMEHAEQGSEAASDMLFIWEEHKANLRKVGPVKPPQPAPFFVPPPLFEDDVEEENEDDDDNHVDEDIDEDDDF